MLLLQQIAQSLPSAPTTTTPAPDAPGLVVRPVTEPMALDMFGRLRTSEPNIVWANSHAYNLDTLAWEVRTSGATNTAVWDANKRQVTLTLAEAGYVVLQSRRYILYQPGRPVRLILTGPAGAHEPGVVKEWGQFDAKNGLFFRQTMTGGIEFVRRTAVSGSVVEEVIPQSAWNGDPLDGTGPSGFTLDLAKNQVAFVEYGWLGAAGARWGFYVGGRPVYCHTAVWAGELATSYMQTASLPIRWAIYAAGTPAAPATMGCVCSEVESEGGYYTTPQLSFSAGRRVAGAIATNSEAPIIGIRPALVVPAAGIVNRVQIDVQDVDVLAISASLDWRLLYYPPGTADPLTGGAWARANDASAAEVNTAATALSLTGAIEIARGVVAAGGATRGTAIAQVTQALPLVLNAAGTDSPLTSNTGASPAYIVLSALGNGATASGGLRWWEVR